MNTRIVVEYDPSTRSYELVSHRNKDGTYKNFHGGYNNYPQALANANLENRKQQA